jgi:diguanylate cyclase (GGDEF)-like protein
VQRNLSIAVSTVNDENVASIQRLSNVLSLYRLQQWGLMALIIGTMLVMIVLLFTKLLIPLEKSVERVQKGESIPKEYGFSELRRLAESYDDLMEHRNKLEEDLRELSHTDALTGLPNRLAYEEYLKKLMDAPEHVSLTIYSMDVDGLKKTNDRHGHVSGDNLLREAAACIQKTFGDSTGKNIFRTGGDEFVAIRLGDTQEQCRSALAAFREEQERRGISISVGHAYLPDIRGEKLLQMFEEADHNMYEAKAERHRDAEAHNT